MYARIRLYLKSVIYKIILSKIWAVFIYILNFILISETFVSEIVIFISVQLSTSPCATLSYALNQS